MALILRIRIEKEPDPTQVRPGRRARVVGPATVGSPLCSWATVVGWRARWSRPRNECAGCQGDNRRTVPG